MKQGFPIYKSPLPPPLRLNRIKEVLKEKGVSQTYLCERINKSFNMVNSYVQNPRQPSIETLFKIAMVLDCEPSELINPSNRLK